MVKDHFGNGQQWGVEIQYIDERQQMGTGGALSLLSEKPKDPFLVMNGDLLTKVNFDQLLDFHLEHKAQATMCVREYDFQIPFGVVQIEDHRIVSIDEKPTQRFFVNAGIYVFEPNILEHIPQNSYFDMPNLFKKLLDANCSTATFPIREYWLDIGRMEDFTRASSEFAATFQ